MRAVGLGIDRLSRVKASLNYCLTISNECVDKQSHINGIESFGPLPKPVDTLQGHVKTYFYFHLKECEFRFKHRKEVLYKMLLKCSGKILSAKHNQKYLSKKM
jgi:hypothetical protein